MNEDIQITKINEVYLRIDSNDSGILQEINEYFTFELPNAKYMPSVRAKLFDGKIRIYNLRTRTLPYGLLPNLLKFCKSRNYTSNISKDVTYRHNITREELAEYADSLPITVRGTEVELRDYQLDAFVHAILEGRCLTISPTACLDGNTLIEAEISD